MLAAVDRHPARSLEVYDDRTGQSMTEHEITDLLMSDSDDLEVVIPRPRSGSHYELWKAEVYGYHGCLDAPVGD